MSLNAEARDTLRTAGVSQAAWTRHHFGDDAKTWRGDACGCPDDRCIGYHHDEQDDCGCLTALLGDYVKALRDFPAALGGSQYLPDYDEDQNATYHEQLTADLSNDSPTNVTALIVDAARHAKKWGGHVFDYQGSTDLFRCTNDGCGKYEVSVRDRITRAVIPCQPIVDAIAGGWSTDGYWIGEGAPVGEQPDLVSRCGGPGVCKRCAMEQALLRAPHLDGEQQ